MFQNGVYNIYLSTETLREIKKCSEPKRSDLLAYLSKIEYEIFEVTDEALRVAHQLISMGILTKKSFDDCQHIGVAVVNECDCIILNCIMEFQAYRKYQDNSWHTSHYKSGGLQTD